MVTRIEILNISTGKTKTGYLFKEHNRTTLTTRKKFKKRFRGPFLNIFVLLFSSNSKNENNFLVSHLQLCYILAYVQSGIAIQKVP
jgi:hypothetical protein